MKGTELKLSGTRQDFDTSTGDPVVLMQFTGKGNKAFEQVTKNEAVRGQIQQDPQHFAIVLDNEIRSWPQIDYNDLPNGIDPAGTGAQITGMANLKEAKNLALVLQTGALPVNFVPLERTDVSATLGKDSLKQARNAAIGGLILVALFLLLLYRFLGARRRDRPRHLRRLHVRRDRAAGGDAHAARLRWVDPDDRRRRRRERRRLRTHQGGVRARANPCAPRSATATRRASARSSTPTSSPRSPR